MVRHFGGLTLINPGTLKRDERPGAAMLDLADRSYEHIELRADGRAVISRRVPLDRGDWPAAYGRG